MTQSFDTRRPAAPGAKPGAGASRGRLRPGAGGALLACFLVSACTALPEWVDPGGWFQDETPPPTRISAAQDLEQAQSGEFPNLASVPDAPRTATPPATRSAIAAGLAADRANASYSGERLVASGAEPAAGAPAAPAIAQSLGAAAAPPRQAAAVPAPAASPPAGTAAGTAGGISAGSTTIAPAPRQTPAQGAGTGQSGGLAAAMAQAPVVVPGTAVAQAQTTDQARALAIPRRSELAGIIYFAHGSHTLDANDRQVLRDILALSRERGATIRVVGHASARTRTVDPVEHQVANLEISQKRADSVAAALIRLGAARDRVRIEAQSDSLPVYHEFMPTGEAGNRRAEIFLEY